VREETAVEGKPAAADGVDDPRGGVGKHRCGKDMTAGSLETDTAIVLTRCGEWWRRSRSTPTRMDCALSKFDLCEGCKVLNMLSTEWLVEGEIDPPCPGSGVVVGIIALE